MSQAAELFDIADKNKDGVLTHSELKNFAQTAAGSKLKDVFDVANAGWAAVWQKVDTDQPQPVYTQFTLSLPLHIMLVVMMFKGTRDLKICPSNADSLADASHYHTEPDRLQIATRTVHC